MYLEVIWLLAKFVKNLVNLAIMWVIRSEEHERDGLLMSSVLKSSLMDNKRVWRFAPDVCVLITNKWPIIRFLVSLPSKSIDLVTRKCFAMCLPKKSPLVKDPFNWHVVSLICKIFRRSKRLNFSYPELYYLIC